VYISGAAKLRLKSDRFWSARTCVVRVNRSRFEIIADILQACLLPRGKTRILCKVKLNSSQANEYLTQLTSLGLLSGADGKYETTDKGRQFLSAYSYLGEIIGIPALPLPAMKTFNPLASIKRKL
jgi:predicted transcriptional regulator